MAASVSRIVIGTAAGGTLIAQNTQAWSDGSGRRIVQRYYFSSGTMGPGTYYLDAGTTVTTTSGFPMILTAGAAPINVELQPGETLYAIGAITGTIAVMSVGN